MLAETELLYAKHGPMLCADLTGTEDFHLMHAERRLVPCYVSLNWAKTTTSKSNLDISLEVKRVLANKGGPPALPGWQ